MSIRNFIPFVLPVLMLFACKQEASVTEEESAVDSTSNHSTPSASNPNLVANMPWTFLTHELYHQRITVVSGKADENMRKGHWMDFNDNGTYDYGVWGDKTFDGTWTYDDATKILTLKPNNGKEKMSEWRVMHKDDNLILVGTATYGDNAQQVQWIRHAQRPDKNAKTREDAEEDE